MKNAVTIILLSLTLSGCIYQSVNSNDIETADKICAKNDGKIVTINAHFNGVEYVTCTNRKTYSLTEN